MIKNKKILLGLLFAIMIGAFLVRFIGIENTPAGLYPDEAVNGMDALTANSTGQYKLFYESNNGREGLFINLQAFSVLLFGNSITALKLWSIIFGTLTVFGVFLLGKEIFRSERAGLIGAYLTAFSYWAINFSRIGFRAIMVPLILTFAFYFIYKGLRTKKYSDFIFGGLIYGLGLHTYIAFRVSPLVLIVLLAALILTRKNFLKEYWKFIFVFAIAMFLTALPMLIDFFVTHPEHYASRTSEISILNPQTNKGQLLPLLGKTFGLALAKYNFWGDQNWRHNYPPYPLLNPITGISFLLGFIYMIFKTLHLLWLRFRKKVLDEKLAVYLFLLAWFIVLLIPEFLASEGNPHALRAIGTIPVVMLMATIPFTWIFGKIDNFGKTFKLIMLSILFGVFIFIGSFDTIKYHYFFANNPLAHQSFEANLTSEARYILALPKESEKFVIAQSMQRIPIEFLNDKTPNLTYFYPGEIEQLSPKNLSNSYILMNDFDQDILAKLQLRFPSLKLETIRNSFGDTFFVLKN
jgi:4-amino-4-deoxy-L-arabinose transferase-like glycosyltransferase